MIAEIINIIFKLFISMIAMLFTIPTVSAMNLAKGFGHYGIRNCLAIGIIIEIAIAIGVWII